MRQPRESLSFQPRPRLPLRAVCQGTTMATCTLLTFKGHSEQKPKFRELPSTAPPENRVSSRPPCSSGPLRSHYRASTFMILPYTANNPEAILHRKDRNPLGASPALSLAASSGAQARCLNNHLFFFFFFNRKVKEAHCTTLGNYGQE